MRSSQPSAAPTPLTGAALADAYRACLAHVNAGKLDEFRTQCVADGYVGHAFAGMPESKGADALIAVLKEQRSTFADLKLEPQLIVVSGRDILAMHLMTGTHTGTMRSPGGDIPPTNKKIGLYMFHRLKMNDANRATDEWAMLDLPTMLGQLGLAPKDAEPTRPAMDKGIEGAPIVAIAADDAKEKANLETVKKGNDAFVANKIPDLLATLSDDVVESDQSASTDRRGKKDVEKDLVAFRHAWTDPKLANVAMWAAGDYVVQVMKFEGKHDKDLGKIKKTGKSVSIDVVEIVRFSADGKIDRMWRFMNSMDFATQLGLAK